MMLEKNDIQEVKKTKQVGKMMVKHSKMKSIDRFFRNDG